MCVPPKVRTVLIFIVDSLTVCEDYWKKISFDSLKSLINLNWILCDIKIKGMRQIEERAVLHSNDIEPITEKNILKIITIIWQIKNCKKLFTNLNEFCNIIVTFYTKF